jgi:hypothetical protein
MTGRRARDRVNGIGDAVQRRVGADRHVGADHVVVDRTDETHERQAAVGVGDSTPGAFRHELFKQLRPFPTQCVGAGEAPVTADHHQPVDTAVNQVARHPPTAVPCPEVGATRRAQHRPAQLQDPVHLGV